MIEVSAEAEDKLTPAIGRELEQLLDIANREILQRLKAPPN
jgi:hypothetical protein